MQAPDFTLKDQYGNEHSLASYRGKWLVLYFYPMDNTPGCTTEACSFRDARDVIAELGGAQVVGISKDSVASHQKFSDQYGLNFTILSDPTHAAAKAYDSWGVLSAQRNTFIINPEGEIVKRYEGVEPDEHAAEIIRDLKELQNSSPAPSA